MDGPQTIQIGTASPQVSSNLITLLYIGETELTQGQLLISKFYQEITLRMTH